MKVNMTPNPLDVVTIHASQGDTEARQWEFELHNNGELIDTSEVTEQMVFKSYKGGTEQLLPENGSTPTTSPFLGDIKYPQGLLTDQEFTYRQSPTEEDGLAKITDIKGNTLVWNQLVQSGSGVANNCTKSYDSSTGITTITPTSYTLDFVGLFNLVTTSNLVTNHKYLISAEINPTSDLTVTFGFSSNVVVETVSANKFTRVMSIRTWTESSLTLYGRLNSSGWSSGTFQIKNVQCIDLTQMGLDITDPSDFTSLFPLSYYAYNQGTLLSFNGNGIKTVGKNLLPLNIMGNKSGIVYTYNNDGTISLSGTATNTISDRLPFSSASVATLKKNVEYRVSGCPSGGSVNTYKLQVWNTSENKAINNDYGSGATFTLPEDKSVSIRFVIYSGQNMDGKVIKPMITFADADQTFEPYTSSTTNLPVSTYFPTGTKSAGTVYDELTENKAITRVGSVDLGSLEWTYYTGATNPIFYADILGGVKFISQADVNMTCPKYKVVSPSQGASAFSANFGDKIIGANINTSINGTRVLVRDSSYSDANTFKTAMNGVYLYYELATPTETSFTTASLVTENAEIPLSNEDGTLIGKCTEQLSENPGFIDAKIKLADDDGTCYSNKIQLHVERSPQ